VTGWPFDATFEYLASPLAVRDCAGRIAELTQRGDGAFELDESRLDTVAERVVDSIHRRYPTLDVPAHSRWRHFDVEGSDGLQRFHTATVELSALERARTGLDLIIPSVLVDAGAGARWRFETPSGAVLSRSEGLAIASLEMFLAGGFSADTSQPLRTDADALITLRSAEFAAWMQSSEDRPLIGLQNRLALLQALGQIVARESTVFPNARLGDLADHLIDRPGAEISAVDILSTILRLFGPMWPERIIVSDINLGDAWRYTPPGQNRAAVVPFHKLSQWLTYSVADTLLRSDFIVRDVEQLTGLAEYRNGGLFVDSGVLKLRGDYVQPSYAVDSKAVVEWRALTVHLLDRTAQRVCDRLGRDLSLASILEGGTWHAGRELAFERSPLGDPPLHIDSDGTVF
jgi:hypothetical protein